MRAMKNALITALWGLNAWYVANFAAFATDGPGVGPLAGIVGAAAAYLVLTRRTRARTLVAVPASA